jgi:phosphinothricin acetyltransferase
MPLENLIRPATENDAAAIAAIYNHYIQNSTITFEETVLATPEMAARMAEVAAHGLPWLVLEHDGTVQGYAYASKWKARSAYRFSVEATVYLAPGAVGAGRGAQLYRVLLAQLKEAGFHAVIGGIALPNPASIALHQKFGMRKVAHFNEVGFKFGQWLDVGYWQVVL